jgi:hypothetical protein
VSALGKRNRSAYTPKFPENWIVDYEFEINGKQIVPGTILRFRGRHGTFVCAYKVTHKITGNEWIDCTSDKTKAFYSIKVSEFSKIVKPKKHRTKIAKIVA